MYLCSNIDVKHVLHDWWLENTLYFTLDIYFAAEDTALCMDSQIAALKCAYCQNLHVDTTLTTISSKYVCKCSVCGKSCYESQMVSGNSLALLGVKMV